MNDVSDTRYSVWFRRKSEFERNHVNLEVMRESRDEED